MEQNVSEEQNTTKVKSKGELVGHSKTSDFLFALRPITVFLFTGSGEKREFQAETQMLLDIVAKSLYSNSEVRLKVNKFSHFLAPFSQCRIHIR